MESQCPRWWSILEVKQFFLWLLLRLLLFLSLNTLSCSGIICLRMNLFLFICSEYCVLPQSKVSCPDFLWQSLFPFSLHTQIFAFYLLLLLTLLLWFLSFYFSVFWVTSRDLAFISLIFSHTITKPSFNKSVEFLKVTLLFLFYDFFSPVVNFFQL